MELCKDEKYTIMMMYTERQKKLKLLQSDIHWNPLQQNDSYLDTD